MGDGDISASIFSVHVIPTSHLTALASAHADAHALNLLPPPSAVTCYLSVLFRPIPTPHLYVMYTMDPDTDPPLHRTALHSYLTHSFVFALALLSYLPTHALRYLVMLLLPGARWRLEG
jgi:hypothetical protein